MLATEHTQLVSDPFALSPIVADGDDVQRLDHLVQSSGFGHLANIIRPAVLDALQSEAEEGLGGAKLAEQSAGLRYRAKVTGLGPVAKGFLIDPAMADLLQTVFRQQFVLSENISCLTCYGDGDHLGAHLDKPASECAVTIIIYLFAQSPDAEAADTGLVLNVYGEDADSVGQPRMRIPTRAGTIVLGRGSKIWHERPRLKLGERVIAITGCFRAAA